MDRNSNEAGIIMKRNILLAGAILAFSTFTLPSRASAVTGDDCLTPVPEVGYRPSSYECNGAAAVLLRGDFRGAYSVVVRRGPNTEFNDRDPNNTSCATA